MDIRKELIEDLKRWEAVHGTSYMTAMWHHVLSSDPGDSCVRRSQYDNSLPYLPVDLGDHGVKFRRDSRILDVGCLGGYGLYDIARHFRVTGSRVWASEGRISFHEGSLEDLSGGLGIFDLVICRLVLPYTRVEQSMRTLREYTRDQGILILQIHAPSYYYDRLRCCFPRFKRMFYYLRPLLNGYAYRLWGRQLGGRWFQEIALSRKAMLKLLRYHGFTVLSELGGRLKPVMICRRIGEQASRGTG